MSVPPAVRKAVIARAGNRCELGGEWVDVENGYYSLQHRRARGSGGSKAADTNTAVNLVLLCGSATTGHHGWVESHPLEALEDGWRVYQGQDPAAIPIRHWEHGPVLLNDQYGYTFEEPVSA